MSRIKPLWLSPSTTREISHPSINQFIRTPIPIDPVPGTDHPYRCQLLAGLLKQNSLTHQCEVLFCPADNSKRYSCFDYLLPTWSVYPLWPPATCPWPRLPCVSSITCLPPASTLDPACLAFILSPVCRLPRPLTPPALRLFYHLSAACLDPCLLSVYDSALLRYPWRCYQICACLTCCTSNKAAYGSQRHWLRVTKMINWIIFRCCEKWL